MQVGLKLLILPFIFIVVLCNCNNTSISLHERKIALLVLGDFDDKIIDFIAHEILQFYGCKTIKFSPLNLPQNAYNSNRNRYRADTLLNFLKTRIPDSIDNIIGFTNEDISVSIHSSSDWGVFGYGHCPGKCSVVSSFRLGKNKVQREIFITRIKNVVLHELGHNFGLPHCPDTNCLMKDAKGKLSSVEGSDRKLCSNCKNKIHLIN